MSDQPTTPSDRLTELLADLELGTLDDAGRGELLSIIAENPDAAALVGSDAMLDGLLTYAAGTELSPEEFSAGVLARIDAEESADEFVAEFRDREQEGRRPSMGAVIRFLTPALVIAAALVLALMWWPRPVSQSGDVAAAGGITGPSVEILKAGTEAWRPIRKNEPVEPGDAVRTGEESELTLAYGDGTEVVLREEGELGLLQRTTSNIQHPTSKAEAQLVAAKRLRLRRGAIAASVAKQPEGAPMVLNTPQLQSTVLGTKFWLMVVNAAQPFTRLDVTEGSVQCSVFRVGQHLASSIQCPASAFLQGTLSVPGRGLSRRSFLPMGWSSRRSMRGYSSSEVLSSMTKDVLSGSSTQTAKPVCSASLTVRSWRRRSVTRRA